MGINGWCAVSEIFLAGNTAVLQSWVKSVLLAHQAECMVVIKDVECWVLVCFIGLVIIVRECTDAHT